MNVFYAKVGGKFYPLVFSLGAKKQIGAIKEAVEPLVKFRGAQINKLSEDVQIQIISDAIECVSVLAEILMRQGAAYKNRFESNNRTRPNDAVDENGVWQYLTSDEIQVGAENTDDFKNLVDAVLKCITTDNEIKTISKKKQPTKKHR